MYAPSPRLRSVPSVRPFALLLALLTLLAAPILPLVSIPQAPAPPTWGTIPLAFTSNRGQSDPRVHFQVRSLGGTLFFTNEEVVLALPPLHPPSDGAMNARPMDQHAAAPAAPPTAPPPVVRVQFDGAQAATVVGTAALPGVVNYFVGNDPAKWHTNVPTYGGVVCQQLYHGVDLMYHGTDGHLKGTYHVAAGAHPSSIRWRYTGATSTMVAANGDLVDDLQVRGGATPFRADGSGAERVPRRASNAGVTPRVSPTDPRGRRAARPSYAWLLHRRSVPGAGRRRTPRLPPD